MKMIARIRTVVDVPFDFDVQPPDADGNSPSRAEATDYAVATLLPQLLQAVAASGEFLEDMSMVEEVREAEEA